MIEQYATNEEVMRIFKCSRPDVAFRAIRKYADEYPGHIEVVKVFGKNVVHRGDLMSFTRWYNEREEYASHEVVDHSLQEFVRGAVYTNTAESWIALLKRGYVGVYHHFSEKHTPRYLAEYQARWNMIGYNEAERLDSILKSTPGLKLTYKELIA